MSLSDKKMVIVMAGKYQLYKDKAGKYRFRLVAENGRTIASGEAYERRSSCLKGIESVKKNVGSSIEDTTIDSPKIPFPKYQILVDKAGEFRFNLSASNGEVIASSEGYSTKEGCMNGISAVRRIGNSEIEDLTIAIEKKEEASTTEPKPEARLKEENNKILTTATEEQKEAPIIEPEPVVVQKEVQPEKQPEPEEKYQEVPAVTVPTPKEITTRGNEIETEHQGISILALAVLAVGLVVGVILLAIGLGFGGFFGDADGLAKGVTLSFGALVISASILFFFAKK
jgi:hypothetical protein